MNVFVDTSAILAMIHAQDKNHQAARVIWQRLLDQDEPVWSTNYVLVESISLLQARYGVQFVDVLQSTILPLLQIIWIDATVHAISVRSLLVANRRRLSLVDCSSMVVARRSGIQHFFAFDQHFDEQRFTCLTA